MKRLLILSLLFSGSLAMAASPLTPLEKAERLKQHQEIHQRGTTITALLAAELLSHQHPLGGLMMYTALWNKEKRPEIAERTIEMALDQDAVELADLVYQEWKKISPKASYAQNKTKWEIQLKKGETSEIFSNLPQLLKDAEDDETRSQLFLQITQMALEHPKPSKEYANEVHQLAKKHQDLSEAIVADLIYSTLAERQKDALKALKKLSQQEMTHAIGLSLKLLDEYEYNLMDQFFIKNGSENLASEWRQMHIRSLIRQKKIDEAYQLVVQELEQNPDIESYTRAGILAWIQNEPNQVIESHFNKAYAQGNKGQQARLALVVAKEAWGKNQWEMMQQWTNRIHDGVVDYDKKVLQALYAGHLKQWDKVEKYIKELRALKKQQAVLFSEELVENLHLDMIKMGMPVDKAEKELNQMIQKAETQSIPDLPQLAQLYSARGWLYSSRMRQPERAIFDLEKYVHIDANNPYAYNSLGYTMLSIPSRVDEGVQWLEKALKILPNDPAIMDSVGWGYYLQGKTDQALPLIEKAYNSFKDAEIGAHWGEILWQKGEKEKAMSIWKESWELNRDDPTLNETLKKLNIHF